MLRRLRTLNLGQRVIIIVALAGVMSTIGTYTVHPRNRGGWFAYTPVTGEAFHPGGHSGWSPFPAALFWIALILLWGAASVWLLGPSRRSAEDPRQQDS